jgi:hypothetical protein
MEKNLNFDLSEIVLTFGLSHNENCEHLTDWLNASYELDEFDHKILTNLHETIRIGGEYMNEEELKAKMVGLIFYVANIEIPRKVMVFYERPLSGVVNDIPLSVICDCIVATPVINAPKTPYFFLQELKKSKGEKKDPEAQMLVAMLLAQEKNNDEKPIYGAYLIGTGWHFSTLIGNDYCISPRIEVTTKDCLLQVIYTLKKLKELIINR